MPQIKFIKKVICLPVSEMFLSYKNNTQSNVLDVQIRFIKLTLLKNIITDISLTLLFSYSFAGSSLIMLICPYDLKYEEWNR